MGRGPSGSRRAPPTRAATMARPRGTRQRRPGRAVWRRPAHRSPAPPFRSSAQGSWAAQARPCLRRSLAPISADGPVCRASGHWRPRVAADSHRRGGFCSDAAGGYYRRIAHPLRPERAPVSRVLPRRLSPFYHHTGTPRDERSTSRWWRRHRPSVSIAPRRSHTPGRHTDLQREDPRVDFVHVEAPLAGDPNPGERSKRDPAADGPPASESFEGPGSVIGRQQPARARVRGPRGRARPRPAFMAKRTAHAGH